MFFCGLHDNLLNIFQHVVYFSSAFWDHTGQCCEPVSRDHLEKNRLCFELILEIFWPVWFLGVIQQGNALIEKNKSERQDKSSLVFLPGKELQAILCNVFILIFKIVLLSRFNDSSRLSLVTETRLPSRTGDGVHGADTDAWGRTHGAGTSLGLSTGCATATWDTSRSTEKDVPKISSLS